MEGQPSAIGEFQPWRAQLLGPFKLEKGGQTASFRTRKTAALLAYLVHYAGRDISKEQLIEALWPDADAEKGRQSLRMAISSIRATLGSSHWNPVRHIQSDRHTVSVSEDGFVSDARAFRKHLQAAQAAASPAIELAELKAAVELYSGSFLAGHAEEWILPHALELEEAYAQGACRLVELTAQSGDLPSAIATGRAAITKCPNREDLHVAMMRAYAGAGQAAAALRQYEELERMLDEQWGEMPSDEARAALESLPRHGQEAHAIVFGEGAVRRSPAVERTPFFGRAKELADLKALLQPNSDAPRLITLFGLGGTGKTRLAQKLADEMASLLPDRVWFVPLVGADEPAQIHERLFAEIVLSHTQTADMMEAVVAAVGSAPALLVFDNLEHVIPAAKATAEQLIANCPGLRILATSRVPLDSAFERVVPLAPLPLPADYRDLSALRESPSIQLLVESAQSVRPGFAVTTANAHSVLLLCKRLDGIPLAIELAAAKLATLSPAQVLASLATSIDLTTDKTAFPERHRSLDTVLQWSLGLLTQDQREAFATLSLCRDGFNSELAGDLLGPPADAHLMRLGHCALLTWHETADEVRFEMLETVREMAAQLLEKDARSKTGAILKHFAYVRRLCASFHAGSTEEETATWVSRMVLDTGNVLAALEFATQSLVDAEQAWEVALTLQHLIERRGRSQLWIGPLENLLEATRPELSSATAARAHMLLAEAHYGLRAIRSTLHHCGEAIKAADESGDVKLRIDTRVEFTTPAITIGEFDKAERLLQSAIPLLPADDPKLAARCYLNLAWLKFDSGNEVDSEPIFRQAVAFAEQSGNQPTIGSALTGLASAIGHSRYEESQLVFDRAVGIWTTAGLPGYLAHCIYNRCMIDYRHGKLDVALANLSKAFRIYIANDIALGQTILTIAGNLMAALGRFVDAAAFWGRAEAARQRYGMLMIPTVARDYDREILKVRAAIPPADLQEAFDLYRFATPAVLGELLFSH